MKILLFPLIILVACTQDKTPTTAEQVVDLSAQAKKEIWDADIAMSDQAVKEGFNKTIFAWAADSLVKPQEGEHPVIGKKALEAYFAGREDFKTLSWKPFTADASRSGDMGYTIGNWTLAAPDTTYHGNYYTIWKRQADGSWKWVADGGNNTPAPLR